MRQLIAIFAGFLGMAALPIYATPPADPAWWTSGNTSIIAGNTTAANYAPVNLGQLKNVAAKARLYLNDQLASVGGAGPEIDALVNGFTANTSLNYGWVSLGHVKAVAKPFYDRLIAVGYDTKANLDSRMSSGHWYYDYPWQPYTPPETNALLANLGQLKMAFSFDLGNFTVPGKDTDHDGLPDVWEVAHSLSPFDNGSGNITNGPLGDPDGDSLTNAEEYAFGTDPRNTDTDGDSISDYDEVYVYHADPNNTDTDGDGLSDYEETHGGGTTNPFVADTDHDGLTDGEENALGTDPNNPDSDGDGVLDGDEVAWATDPLNADTDNDGVDDYSDAAPLDPAVQYSASLHYTVIDIGPGVVMDMSGAGDFLTDEGTIYLGGNTYPAPGGYTWYHLIDGGVFGVENESGLPATWNGEDESPTVLSLDMHDGVYTGLEWSPEEITVLADPVLAGVDGDTYYFYFDVSIDGYDPVYEITDYATWTLSDGWVGFYVGEWPPPDNGPSVGGSLPSSNSQGLELVGGSHLFRDGVDIRPEYSPDGGDPWWNSVGIVGLADAFAVGQADTEEGVRAVLLMPDIADDNWDVQQDETPVYDDTDMGPTEDKDHDGLTNTYEWHHGTNWQSTDTDSDGMDDGWEVAHGLNPLVNDAGDDADGDGYSNEQEYLGGSDPQDPESIPPPPPHDAAVALVVFTPLD